MSSTFARGAAGRAYVRENQEVFLQMQRDMIGIARGVPPGVRTEDEREAWQLKRELEEVR